MNKLKAKLQAGNTCLGTHISLNDPAITELTGNIGFDYLWIDTEHTAIGLDCLQQHLIAARASGVSAVVRVPCVDQVRVKPILEMGPDGIIFPQVNSYELAKTAIEACMYPPKGNRGFGPRRAIQFGRVELDEYYRTVDAELMRMLQVENIGAVEELERIVTVEGMPAARARAACMGRTGWADCASWPRRCLERARAAPRDVMPGRRMPDSFRPQKRLSSSTRSLQTGRKARFLRVKFWIEFAR